MTLYKFKKLAEIEQALVTWEQGAFVAQRTEGTLKIILFQLFGFYVEVFFDQNKACFQKLRPFTSTHQLKDYLQKIDISEITDLLHPRNDDWYTK